MPAYDRLIWRVATAFSFCTDAACAAPSESLPAGSRSNAKTSVQNKSLPCKGRAAVKETASERREPRPSFTSNAGGDRHPVLTGKRLRAYSFQKGRN
jgi:hypothetical protein